MRQVQTSVEQPAVGDECVLLHDSLDPYLGSDSVSVRGSVLFSSPVRVITCNGAEHLSEGFKAIERALDEDLFVAGGFSYELGYHLEARLEERAPKDTGPLFQVAAFAEMTRLESDAVGALIGEKSQSQPMSVKGEVAYSLDRATYEKTLEKVHDYILAGDIYQVNFTFPTSFPWSGDIWHLYGTAAPYQSVAFGAVLDLPDFKIASLSPELFFRKRGQIIESRPMKGTIRRGVDAAEDTALRNDLHGDVKNRAENLMIVDLIRNDLGRMAEIGSVSVENLFQVETYHTLHQMVSTVRAKIEGRPSLETVFRHLFPCGSVTGAPKIRAMEIIAELETSPRGLYTGAIGYVTPERDMTLSVPIRTISLNEGAGRATMGIGSGVVADSRPTDEYDECLLKAQFLRDALSGGPGAAPGLIETMRSQAGGIPLLADHQTRLKNSAAALGIAVQSDDIWASVMAHVKSTEGEYRVRLEVAPDGNWEITSSVLTEAPSEALPVVLLSGERLESRNPLLRHKTTRRDVYDRARQALQGVVGAFDVLLFNERGELCEGAISNVFLEKDGVLMTPSLDSGLLPGIMRARVIAEQSATEQTLYKEDLLTADRVFISNAVRGLIEVRVAAGD